MSDTIIPDDETEPGAPMTGKAMPNEPRRPKYEWGVRVVAAVDLFNDGSHPHVGIDALLVPAGTPGEIVRIGHAPEENVPVYLVEFPAATLVGCLEEEITPVLGERRQAPGVM